jgi:hypothetical protein
LQTDLAVLVDHFDLPVYFFTGHHDYTANHQLSEKYFAKLKAPLKGHYRFYHSAHSPLFEEPVRALHILREDVLKHRNSLADYEYRDGAATPNQR